MDVTGLGWCGTRTEHDQQLAHFYEHVLGLRPVHAEPGLRVFELPDGRNVEVFGPLYQGREHFDRGPVVGWISGSAVSWKAMPVPGVPQRSQLSQTCAAHRIVTPPR
jgi:hypothetical protein